MVRSYVRRCTGGGTEGDAPPRLHGTVGTSPRPTSDPDGPVTRDRLHYGWEGTCPETEGGLGFERSVGEQGSIGGVG